MSEVSKMGRPTLFNDDLQEKILKMAELGLTDKQVAYICGVTYQTVNNWKIAHPDFFDSLKISKELADMHVEQSLYQKAKGGLKTTEIHDGIDATGNVINKTVVRELAPDNTAMIFWLKNRQPNKWREKQEVEHTVSEIKIDKSDEGL
jgi:hypothetical protein